MTASPGQRHIVLCTTYYWPETTGNAPYATAVAEHLAGLGHRVSVVGGFPHYPEWRAPVEKRAGATERRNGVEIRRRWHYVPQSQSALRRGAYELSLAATGWTALGPRSKADAVVAIVPTLAAGAMGLYASKLYRAPLGVVFQDLMGLGAEQNGVKDGKRYAGMVSRFELQVARRAAGVAVISDGFREYLEAAAVEPGRVRVLRNWTHCGEPTETVQECRERLGWGTEEFICLHSGNMGQKQGLDNLLDAAAVMQERGLQGIRLVLAGDGNDRPRLQARARAMGLRNVSFTGLQAEGQYEAMLASADVLIAHQRRELTNAALPSRLTSYFRAGRPVLAVASAASQTAKEIEGSRAGLVTAPGEPAAVADAIEALLKTPELRRECGANARAYSENELGREAALDRYAQFVDDLMGVTK